MSEQDTQDMQLLQDGITEIQCDAVSQSNILPELEQECSRQKLEFEAVLNTHRACSKRALSLEQDERTLEVQSAGLQALAAQARDEAGAEHHVRTQHLVEHDRLQHEIMHIITKDVEESMKPWADKFRSAVVIFDEGSVQREIDEARSKTMQLDSELLALQYALAELRQRFHRDPHPAVLAAQHTPDSLTRILGGETLKREVSSVKRQELEFWQRLERFAKR